MNVWKIFSASLQFLISTLCLTIVYCYFDYGRRCSLYERRRQSVLRLTSGSGRLLNSIETFFHHRNRVGDFLDANIVFIESDDEPIGENALTMALTRLAAKHPMLRAKIVPLAASEYFAFEEIIPFSPDVTVLRTSNWLSVLESEMEEPLPSSGPLWRVKMLDHSLQDGVYKNLLVFTCHHAMVDGVAIMKLYDELLNELSICADAERSVESLPDVIPRSLPLDFFHCVPRRCVEIPWTTKVSIYVRLWLIGKMPSDARNNAPFFQIAGRRGLLPKPKTRMIPIELSKTSTAKVLAACRVHGCKLQGVLQTVARMALTATAREIVADPTLHLEIRSTFAANLRRLTGQALTVEDVVGAIDIVFVPPKLVSSDDDFWKAAKATDEWIRAKVKEERVSDYNRIVEFQFRIFPREHRRACSDFNSMRDDETPTWLDFMLSNRGAFSLEGEGAPRRFRATGTFYGVGQSRLGTCFSHFVVTLGGKLFWTLDYHENLVTAEAAQLYAKHVREILDRIAEGRI